MKFILGEIWGICSVSAAIMTDNWIIGLACFLIGVLCSIFLKIDTGR